MAIKQPHEKVFKFISSITVVKEKVSIVTGLSVSKIRFNLKENGFDENLVTIQGVDIDKLDKKALKNIYGEKINILKDLPIVVAGIGTKSLSTILRPIKGVSVRSGGLDSLVARTATTNTITVVTPLPAINNITMDPIIITERIIDRPYEPATPLIIEGIPWADLEKILKNACVDLSTIKVRPLKL